MAYDDALADNVRKLTADEIRKVAGGEVGGARPSAGQPGVTEKRMFGGLAVLLDGNMAVVVRGRGGLMVRVDPDDCDAMLDEPGTSIAVMRDRPMRGWLVVEPGAVAKAADLRRWVKRGVAYARTLPPKER